MALVKQVRPALNKSEGEAAQVSPKVLEDVCLLDMKLHQAQGELEGRGPSSPFSQRHTLDQVQENGWIVFMSPISASK